MTWALFEWKCTWETSERTKKTVAQSQKWNLNIYKVGSLSLERFYVVLLLRFHDGSELEERFPVLT